jgi:hypothetical protein
MSATLRNLIFTGLLAVTLLIVWGHSRAAAQGASLRIEAHTLIFNAQDPEARRLGALTWRRGLQLAAAVPEFGGWSDLNMSLDGRTLTAVSDRGAWLTATVEYDGDGNLGGVTNARLGVLRDLAGMPLTARGWREAEGLAQLADGSWLVSFERHHRLWRYPTLSAKPVVVDSPAEMTKQPASGGIKALAALADGRLVAISQNYSLGPGKVVGWIGQPAVGGSYKWQDFNLTVPGLFRPTSMAQLPDGSLVVLESAFDTAARTRCRLVRIAASDLVAGNTVRGSELATLARPYLVENFEAVSTTRGRHGEILIWLLSNDDFNPLQRNLLLQFELAAK